MNKRFSVEEVEFIRDNYGRISFKEIAEKLERSYSSIETKIYKLGLSKGDRVDAPNANISFFEEWSQELAYVVGFFLADGNMVNYHKEGHYGIRFSITDKDVIEKIVKACGYKNSIKSHIDKTSIFYNISISSKFVWKFFENLGFTHNKTFTTRIPKQIPQELMNHFIRDVFDGDGSVWLNDNAYPQANITGSKLFINDVSKLCVEHSGVYHYNRSFTIRYSGQKAIDFLNYIYKDATIYMDRKHKRYLKGLKWRNSRNSWTDQELELLNSLGPVTDMDQLISVFNRSCGAIRVKASKLSIKIKSKAATPWSNTDIRLLKSLYPMDNTRKLSSMFNKSTGSIRQKAYRLGLKNTKRKRKI